jgi:hypothetical protein
MHVTIGLFEVTDISGVIMVPKLKGALALVFFDPKNCGLCLK